MAAQHAGGKCPRDLKVFDVVLIDVTQLAISYVVVGARRHHPIGWILLHDQEFLARRGRRWND